jgi:hypothetical protein
MKYTLTVDIGLPLTKVIELFDNPQNWSKWREGFISFNAMIGTPGEQGSKTKLVNRIGPSETAIIETVEVKALPGEMTCTYEAPGFWMGAWNRASNRFSELGPNKTQWEFESEFRCRGLLKVMSFLIPSMFQTASLKEMNNFKKFAEEH